MSTKSKTLAKSLHTVTALVKVARLIATASKRDPKPSDVDAAAVALGYSNASDPYDLRGKAREILEADAE
jgi:hypothetical protein